MTKPYYRPIEKETYRQPSTDRLRWYQRLSAQKKCLIHVDTFLAGRTVQFAFVHKFWYTSRGASTSLYYMVPAEFFAGGTGDFIITDADWATLKKHAANGRVAYAAQDIYEYRIEKAENVHRAPIRRADTPIFRQGEKVYILSPYTWGDGEAIKVLVKLPTARNMHPVAKTEDRIVMYYAHLTSTCPPTEASIIPNGSLSAT